MKRRRPPYPIAKRSFVTTHGKKSSLTLEEPFWQSLKAIAREAQVSVPNLIHTIERERISKNLSSSIRVFILEHFKARARELMP